MLVYQRVQLGIDEHDSLYHVVIQYSYGNTYLYAFFL